MSLHKACWLFMKFIGVLSKYGYGYFKIPTFCFLLYKPANENIRKWYSEFSMENKTIEIITL